MGHVKGFARFVAGIGIRVLGVLAAVLPKRWWPHLDPYVPASDMAFASGLVTFLASAAIGIPGYLAFVTDLADRMNRVALATPGQAAAGASSVLMMLSLLTFVLFTPAGLVALYLGMTGILRMLAAAITDGFGDPILTLVDAGIVRAWDGGRAATHRWQRESREGPPLPDRIMGAAQLGIDGADFVIVSSRRKPEWDKGSVLLTGDGAFRITSIEERTVAGRLRTLYGVAQHRDLEVFRRTVPYDLPPGRKA